ncbi:hypothetical protein GGU11DRAFT_589167 [Lentinula aff. detonsa]|nr:hypothetical protein GGU11DRAFT_589167 [Lentinula aff. detonsa]
MDVHMRPAREDKTRANSPQLVPVRPNLPLSRSESAAASTGHSSTSAQLPTYSTSIKPSSVAAPQRVLVNPLPDVPVLSKSYSGPVRVDPRAGRDPGGSSKSVHHRATSNELSADTVGGLNRTRHESKESNPRSMKVNPTEKPPTVGNGQGPSSTDTISNAATTKMTATSSQAAKLPHYAQPVASSRARSVSASTSVGAITRPPTSRTRTISTSTTAATSLGSTKPLVARTRTISSTAAAASTSAAAVAVVRSAKPKTTNSTDTNVIRSVTSAPGSLKPTWGSSSSYRSVAPVASKRAARSDVPKASSSNGKRNGKQKRPSVVPEELDEVLTAPGIPSGGGTRKDSPEDEERVEGTPLEDESTSQVIEVNTESSQGEEQEVSLVMESAATEAHESESPLIDFSPIQEREQSMQHVSEYSGQKNSKALTTPAAIKPNFDLIPMEPSSTVEPHTNDTPVEVTVTSSTPLLPETPVRVQGQNSDLGILPVQVEATPISALLSSIQRGFLFTPATPLSPPDSYLPKETGGSSVMPFPLFSSKSAPAKLAGSEEVIHEHSKYSDGKARQALETLDVN